eukprot:1157350-Pelagomonas_calceolata.AAC.2
MPTLATGAHTFTRTAKKHSVQQHEGAQLRATIRCPHRTALHLVGVALEHMMLVTSAHKHQKAVQSVLMIAGGGPYGEEDRTQRWRGHKKAPQTND